MRDSSQNEEEGDVTSERGGAGHSVRDMDFRSVPEVQVIYRLIMDWIFSASARTLDFATFEHLEDCAVQVIRTSCW